MLGLYLRTARYFRPSQILARIRKETGARLVLQFSWLAQRRYSAPANAARCRDVRFMDAGDVGYGLQLQALQENAQRLQQGIFRLLNKELTLGFPVNWNPAETTRLWRYNLHYFDYALDLALVARWDQSEKASSLLGQLFHDWIVHNPVARGVGWHSYPIARRIVNWVQSLSLASDAIIFRDGRRESEWIASLYAQSQYLEDHLEFDCLGNHLLADAKALVFAGLFFEGEAARRWLTRGEEFLWKGLEEQILPDGCHFERSPMYQAIVLQDYLEVVLAYRLNGRDVPAWVSSKLRSMADFLSGVRHPDGEIPLIGDSAFGIARHPCDILAAAEVLLNVRGRWPGARADLYSAMMAPQAFQPAPAKKRMLDDCRSWPDAGYCALQGEEERDWLLIDTKPMGPPNIPAHGHCSLFSYELSIAGERLIVDSGVEEYQPGPWRLFWRSTRAHNTVTVDGAEQSEIWAAFRVGRRIKVIKSGYARHERASVFTGVHNGFVGQSARHRRVIAALPGRLWIILDEITGAGQHDITSFVHFHPDAVCELRGTTAGVSLRTCRMRIHPYRRDHDPPIKMSCVQGQLEPIQGWYAPRFGVRQPNPVLVLSCCATLPVRIGYLIAPEDREITSWKLRYRGSNGTLKVVAVVNSPQGSVYEHFHVEMSAQ